MSRGRRGHAGGHDNSERWMLTYADMITLLLALFIVLFAMSTINEKKFLEFRLGLTQTFNPSAVSTHGGSGILRSTSLVNKPGTNPSPTPVLKGTPNAEQQLPSTSPTPEERMAELIQYAIDHAGLAKDVSVTTSAQGVVVEILADDIFFSSGSAVFGSTGNRIVDAVASVVRLEPNNIEVEGFTDNVPIHTGLFPSNWQLSAVRAANIVARLNAVDHIPESRLTAVGYGPTHPESSNSTPQGRARNRRVDIVILNT